MDSRKLTLCPSSSSDSVASIKGHLKKSTPNLSMSPSTSSQRKYHITDQVSDELQTFHEKVRNITTIHQYVKFVNLHVKILVRNT